jgi:WD40 repeat protein
MGWPVRSLSFSADGGRLAVGRIDMGLTVFDIESGKPVFQRDRLASLGPIVALAWTPDGKYLFAGGQNGQIQSWEVAEPTAKQRTHAGHKRTVGCLAVGPQGRFVISAGHDRSVTWQQPDAPDKARSVTLPGNGDILAIRIGSPPVKALATDGKELFEIDLKTSAISRSVKLDKRSCQSADFSSDGLRVAVSQGREVLIYDTDMGQPKATIQVGNDLQWCVRFTPDGQRLLTGARGAFYVFDAASAKRIAAISVGQPLYVQTMAIDSESRRAAVIPDSAGQTLRVFRLPTSEPGSSP